VHRIFLNGTTDLAQGFNCYSYTLSHCESRHEKALYPSKTIKEHKIATDRPVCSCETPSTNIMYGLSFVRHIHLVVWHEYGRSQGGMVLSWGYRALLSHELVEFKK
jgi:hypothetical protein